MFQNRPEYNTPEYKSWRFHVFSRDAWSCQLCKDKTKKKVEAHHIVKWSVAPQLRYVVSNGITLCEDCHDMVTGREEMYEQQFKTIAMEKKIAKDLKRTNRKLNKLNKKWKPRNPHLRF